jgi:hypothetical protein
MENQKNKIRNLEKACLIDGLSKYQGNFSIPAKSRMILNLALGPDLIAEMSKSWGMSWNMGKLALEYKMIRMLESDASQTGSLGHLNCLVEGKNHELKKLCHCQICICQ